MDWINLAQGRDQWRALVNTVGVGTSFSSAGLKDFRAVTMKSSGIWRHVLR
jgi:hypothetical protein